MAPVICPYCGEQAKLMTSKEFYGRDYGSYIYCCEPCDARVGTHRGSKRPLGTLARPQLRFWRTQAHKEVDPLWRFGTLSRGAVYTWIAEKMGKTPEEAHIGLFSIEECMRVIQYVREDPPSHYKGKGNTYEYARDMGTCPISLSRAYRYIHSARRDRARLIMGCHANGEPLPSMETKKTRKKEGAGMNPTTYTDVFKGLFSVHICKEGDSLYVDVLHSVTEDTEGYDIFWDAAGIIERSIIETDSESYYGMFEVVAEVIITPSLFGEAVEPDFTFHVNEIETYADLYGK